MAPQRQGGSRPKVARPEGYARLVRAVQGLPKRRHGYGQEQALCQHRARSRFPLTKHRDSTPALRFCRKALASTCQKPFFTSIA